MNDSFSSGSFVEIKKTCMENNCNAFCCETEDNCFIISDNWNGDVVEMAGSKLYLAAQTCNNMVCDAEETCIDNKICCPRFKCGKDCSIDNFEMFPYKDLEKHILGEQIPMSDNLVADCKQYCVSDPGCKSFLLYYYIDGTWMCQRKSVTHFEVKLVDHPDSGIVSNLRYFYRTGRCE
ncbi:Uncharacterised protein r2_g3269 [Pycnogonum litorale]